MDFGRNLRTQQNNFGRKISTRINVFKQRYLNKKSLFRLFLPIVVTLILIPAAIYLLVIQAYSRRILTNPDNMPNELKNGVIVIPYSSILYDFDNTKQIFDGMLTLYANNKISHIYVEAYNDSNTIIPSVESINILFKDIPNDKVTIDINAVDIISSCQKIPDFSKENKFVLMGFSDLLPRISFVCNSLNVYVKAFAPSKIISTSNDSPFWATLEDVYRITFKQL